MSLTLSPREGTGWALTSAIVAAMAAVFSFDLFMPLGVAGGVPYVAAVLISLYSRRRRLTVFVAAGCSLLTVVGLFASGPGSILWIVLVNRGIAVFAIWATAGIGIVWITSGRSEALLRQSHADLRALAAHLNHIREEEREKIARDVHDELGQTMIAFKMDLSWLRRRIPDDDPSLQHLVESMLATCDTITSRVHSIAEELRPPGLDCRGLAAAIEWEVGKFEQRSGISCELDCSIEITEVDPGLSIAVFRVLQEALTNVTRHAGATRVEIGLEQTDETLVLYIQDDGRGLAVPEAAARSLGVLGMQERAIAWGGEVTIENVPGKGARVTMQMPLPSADRSQPAVQQ